MAQFLERLTLKNFRGFEAERIKFDNPTFFVGQNGSGKSNLADAILLLSELTSMPLEMAISKHGGLGELVYQPGRRGTGPGDEGPEAAGFGLAANFGQLNDRISGVHYGFEVRLDRAEPGPGSPFSPQMRVNREQCLLSLVDGSSSSFERKDGNFESDVPGLSPNLEPASLGLAIVGGDSRFAPVIRAFGAMHVVALDPKSMRLLLPAEAGMKLIQDGRNAASVLEAIGRESPDDARRILEFLQTIVPDVVGVESVRFDRLNTLQFSERVGDSTRSLKARNMSDGTLRALGLILAAFQPSRPSLLLIEEPEIGVHPGAIGAIMDLIRHASRLMQVIVTTHSPDLLDAKWIEDRHLRVVTREQGSSRIRPISEGSRRTLQRHLMGAGEMLRSNLLYADDPRDGETDEPVHLFVPEP